MAGGLNERRFEAHDFFLRRIDRKRHLRDGAISPDVFRCRAAEPSLSFTYRGETLQSEQALDEYHRRSCLKSGDLPAICRLSYVDLAERVSPPLPPRFKEDPDDSAYGRLHYETDCPGNETQVKTLRHLAQQHGLLRDFVPREKRTDKPIGL